MPTTKTKRVVKKRKPKVSTEYYQSRYGTHFNVYDSEDRWVGFFSDEQAAKAWVRKHKNHKVETGWKRDVKPVPAPKPTGKKKSTTTAPKSSRRQSKKTS